MDARLNLRRTLLLLSAAGLAACSSTKDTKGTSERLQASQFASSSPSSRAAPQQPAPGPTPSPSPTTTDPAFDPAANPPVVRTSQPADTLALRSFVGEPVITDTPAKPTDTPIVLESVIGQINGRPLFASEILTPLDGKLRKNAEASRGDRRRFIQESMGDLMSVITGKVRDELMLAEAQASLPLEARQGLFYFLGRIQQNMISKESGSALQADESLRESSGRTLQQEARDQLEQELIANELRTKVLPRVNIPWRLIRQDYERNYAKYNPNGSVTLRVISVPATNADAVRHAEEAIASKPFAEAAGMDFNTFVPSLGGLARRDLTGTFTESKLFADPAWDEAAWKLKPGETSPAFASQSSTVWVHLESLDPGKSVSLYEAQLEIDRALRGRKFTLERDIYLRRLLERGSFTPIDAMANEAMTIAIERYLPARPQ